MYINNKYKLLEKLSVSLRAEDMYNILYQIYFALNRVLKWQTKKGVVFYWANKIIGYIEAYYNLYVKKQFREKPSSQRGSIDKDGEQKIIISLTSFPKRIATVWITVETLMRQSMKPDKIILWLAESQFDGIESLPKQLTDLQKRGLTIRFCDDLRSHKKYYYTMQEYPEDIIVLVDDDMFYPYDTIEKLWELHEKNPKDVCCITGQVMEPSFQSNPSEWRNPKLGEVTEHSDRLQVFTGSGSLFVPNCLAEEVFDKKLIKELCPYADDLWLTFMAHKKGTRITALNPWRAFPVTIYGTSVESLWFINAQDGKNDEQWKAILEYFEYV